MSSYTKLGKKPLHGKREYNFGTWDLHKGIEIGKAKVEVNEKLSSPISVKRVGSFLGHVGSPISLKGVRSFLGYIGSPITIKGVKSFLRHVCIYRRFIKDFYKKFHPLCKILNKEVIFVFDKAFKGLK